MRNSHVIITQYYNPFQPPLHASRFMTWNSTYGIRTHSAPRMRGIWSSSGIPGLCSMRGSQSCGVEKDFQSGIPQVEFKVHGRCCISYTVHTCTCMYCMYCTCMHIYVYVYRTHTRIYACTVHTVHACTCMYVAIGYMHIRVCMYGTCVYVYACVLHVCTCMHVAHMHTRTRIYRTHTRIYACTVHVQYMHVHVCM